MTTSFAHDTADLAETYDRLSNYQYEGGKRLLRRVRVPQGARVLDLGCGTGRLTRWIAERVGPAGYVVGVDPLPERVAIARSRGPGSVRFEVARAEDLSAFEAEGFDVVCMSAVFHWIDDRAKALREVRRVLRPGGRLGVTTISSDLLMASTVAKTMRSVLGAGDYAAHVDLSKLAVASRSQKISEIVAMLVECELELADLRVRARSRLHPSGDHAVSFLESSAFGNFFRIVPEELRPQLRADLAAAFDRRKGPDGIALRDWGTMFVAARPA